ERLGELPARGKRAVTAIFPAFIGRERAFFAGFRVSAHGRSMPMADKCASVRGGQDRPVNGRAMLRTGRECRTAQHAPTAQPGLCPPGFVSLARHPPRIAACGQRAATTGPITATVLVD